MMARSRRHAGAVVLLAFSVLLAALPTRATESDKPSQPGKARVDWIVDNTANILWEMTDSYFHNGDYEQLIRLAHVVEVLAPDFAQPYSTAAFYEWSDGDNAGALDDLRRGIATNPRNAFLASEMGDCYQVWFKRPADSIPYYIDSTQDYVQAEWVMYEQLAHAAEAVGDFQRAEIALQTAILKGKGEPLKENASRHNLERVRQKLQSPRVEGAGSGGASAQVHPTSSPTVVSPQGGGEPSPIQTNPTVEH